MNKKRNWGLKSLSPKYRLLLVFVVGVVYVFVYSVTGAFAVFGFGLIFFLIGNKPNLKLTMSVLASALMMLIYNTIFSPSSGGGFHWFIFTANQEGFSRGIVTGFRLAGVLLLSLSWLASTTIPEMYAGLAGLKFANEWVLGILRGIQINNRQFVALTQSLLIRGLRWDSFVRNIKNLVPLVTAIIPRIFVNAQKDALAMSSHHPLHGSGDGVVNVIDLSARYSPRFPDAIVDISVQLKPGETVYLAGRNMAGKSTLLMAIAGVMPWVIGETRGEVTVSGLYTHDFDPKLALRMLSGIVRYIAPDPFSSIYGLTVEQELMLLTENEGLARQAARTMGIEGLWDQETTKLSGGQQVRLVLAGALLSKAKILLFDSPLQELDPQGRKSFVDALRQIRENTELTVVIADQFWHEFSETVDRVLVMQNGTLAADMRPKEFNSSAWPNICGLDNGPFQVPHVAKSAVVATMQNVHVSLDGNPILDGLDLVIRSGELIALTGPNGSGKTTAMITLAGAIKPSQGSVVVQRGRVGYCFQDASLQISTLTVGEELAFGPKILGWSQTDQLQFVADGLKWAHLRSDESPLDLHPTQQRLLTIAALKCGVSILILDEPTIGLDSFHIQKVLSFVSEALRLGIAVIVITHDLRITKDADRILGMEAGRITEERRP